MSEIVYVLTNPAMPGYTKIGKTSNGLKSRMHQLDSTGVPLPFECFYAAVVKDSSFVEKQLHEAFLDQRVRSNREFFEISPERVRAALKLVEIEDATPDDTSQTAEDQVALDKARTRRANFNFTMVGIPSGSTLEYVRDSSVTAKVIDDKNIEFNGEILSLSVAAQKAAGVQHPLQGPIFWIYNGRTLDKIRKEVVGD